MGYCFIKKTILSDSKMSEFGRKSEEDKVGHFVGMYSGYFSTQQIYVGYDDPIRAVALEKDCPDCFKEWNVFYFDDDSKKRWKKYL
jgi:hypothetical protein